MNHDSLNKYIKIQESEFTKEQKKRKWCGGDDTKGDTIHRWMIYEKGVKVDRERVDGRKPLPKCIHV